MVSSQFSVKPSKGTLVSTCDGTLSDQTIQLNPIDTQPICIFGHGASIIQIQGPTSVLNVESCSFSRIEIQSSIASLIIENSNNLSIVVHEKGSVASISVKGSEGCHFLGNFGKAGILSSDSSNISFGENEDNLVSLPPFKFKVKGGKLVQ